MLHFIAPNLGTVLFSQVCVFGYTVMFSFSGKLNCVA